MREIGYIEKARQVVTVTIKSHLGLQPPLPLLNHIMPGLDNANPIIFKPTQQSIRKSEKDRFFIWEDEVSDVNELGDGVADEVTDPDPIDEQEVFGE